jgi:hypothetical protein
MVIGGASFAMVVVAVAVAVDAVSVVTFMCHFLD